MTHDDDTCPHLVRANLLESENARLKVEVASLKSLCDNLGIGGKHTITAIADENARLKAEVERLTSVSEAWKKRRLDKVEAECIDWSDYEKLKAENERLCRHGDLMLKFAAANMPYPAYATFAKDWLDVKESKKS